MGIDLLHIVFFTQGGPPMKKALMLFLTVVGNSALIFADGKSCQKDCFLDCPKKPPKPCKKPCEKVLLTECKTVRQTPPCECVRRWCDCGTDLFVTADFIYWVAREDSLDFCYTTGSSTVVGNEAIPSQGKSFHVGKAWNPGFKVGAGMNFCEYGWDVYTQYTWYRMKTENRDAGPSAGQTLYDGFWFVNNPNNNIASSWATAQAEWKVAVNALDMELGRAFFIGEQFMLRPHAGLKWVSNRDRFHLDFGNSTRSSTMQNHVESWGVGIRTGLDADWHFNRCFSIFGETALTGLWESFEAKRLDNTYVFGTATNSSFVNIKEDHDVLLPILEWKLGVRWENWWTGDNYHFALDAAWEQQIWFDQNNFVHVAGAMPSRSRDLMLQGLTVGARFDF